MNKIILDVDTGLDDAFALLLASKAEEIEICGVTTVAGNCDLENATRNTLKILDLSDRNDIPVYKGMSKALKVSDVDATDVHGSNGLGGVNYVPSIRGPESTHAVDYIINTVLNSPDEITIVAIGPLTNIATAINREPNFARKVKSLVIMGGAIGNGNITPHAEFNFYKDPHAAKVVFEADFNEIVMMGLDVTTKLPLSERYEDILLNMNNDLATFLYDITRSGAEFDRRKGYDGSIMNDPLTIAYLIDPTLVNLRDSLVSIETEGEMAGKSHVTFVEKSNCKVGYTVDNEKFFKILFNKIFALDI